MWHRTPTARGFSLIEALAALALLVTLALGLGHLFILSARTNARARMTSLASILAADQIERLRSLSWAFDAQGLRITDAETDLTVTPERPGGVGLSPSPADALERNIEGYCDFLDSSGRSIGRGGTPPPGTAFIRRWLVEPLAADPTDGLVMQVRVLPIESASGGRVAAGESRMLAVRARKAR
jgi:type II secretory pathway pseudopilin PulG